MKFNLATWHQAWHRVIANFCYCFHLKSLWGEERIFGEMEVVVYSSLESLSSLEKGLIFLHDSDVPFKSLSLD